MLLSPPFLSCRCLLPWNLSLSVLIALRFGLSAEIDCSCQCSIIILLGLWWISPEFQVVFPLTLYFDVFSCISLRIVMYLAVSSSHCIEMQRSEKVQYCYDTKKIQYDTIEGDSSTDGCPLPSSNIVSIRCAVLSFSPSPCKSVWKYGLCIMNCIDLYFLY